MKKQKIHFQPRWSEASAELPLGSLLFLKRSFLPAIETQSLPRWRVELHDGGILYFTDLRWEEDGLFLTRTTGEEWRVPPNAVAALLPTAPDMMLIQDGVPGHRHWQVVRGRQMLARDSSVGFIHHGQGLWGLPLAGWPARFHLSMEVEVVANRFLMNVGLLGQTLNLNAAETLQVQLFQTRVSLRVPSPHPQRPNLFVHTSVWSENLTEPLSGRVQFDIFGDIKSGQFFAFLNGSLVKKGTMDEYEFGDETTPRSGSRGLTYQFSSRPA